MSRYFIPILFLVIFIFAIFKKVKPYDAFTEGAKSALPFAVSVFPYLVTIFVLTELFEVSGLSNAVTTLLAPIFRGLGVPTELTKLILIKPFSGNGSLAVLTEIFNTYGVDSYLARCASVIYGSSETVFYIATVYFGDTSIKKLGVALVIGLFCSFLSSALACLFCRVF